jgi:hypothetical protein
MSAAHRAMLLRRGPTMEWLEQVQAYDSVSLPCNRNGLDWPQ